MTEILAVIAMVCSLVGAPEGMPNKEWERVCISIAQVESNLNPTAVNKVTGDYGLFQINKRSHPAFFNGDYDVLDPVDNALYAIRHLKWLFETEKTEGGFYNYDIQTVLARYNAGAHIAKGLPYADKVMKQGGWL